MIAKTFLWCGLLCAGAVMLGESAAAAQPAVATPDRPFPGKYSDYRGYDRYDFVVGGCQTIVVGPRQLAAGKPWVWRAEFFDAFPQVDLALLAKGFHLVCINVGNTFGCPDALAHWDVLYKDLTERYEFSRKPVLEGLSRGGLYCFNWAANNPRKVGCILADNAVMDFKSWPGGKGKGKGSPNDWKKLLEDYHFKSEAEALAYTKNPVDNLEPLAKARVPLFLLYGDADVVVPYAENGAIVKERYEKLGGPVRVLIKKGMGHHPHGLDDPAPVVEFILKHTTAPAGPETREPSNLENLPPLPEDLAATAKDDWLIVPVARKSGIYRGAHPQEIVMTNGLVRRTWRLAPNAATVGFDNLITGEALLRGVKPEARLQLNGKDYEIGGLKGQPNYAYLRPEWLDAMTADLAAFQFSACEIGKTKERLAWRRVRYAADLPWPPPGVSLTLHFKAPVESRLDKLTVSVHYEMYDGIPLLCKWLTVRNGASKPVRLQKFASEILAVVESESVVDDQTQWQRPNLHVESDCTFCGMAASGANRTTQWLPDPQYTTQVNYNLTMPCMLESRPPIGPDQWIGPGQTFESFRTFELALDSSERERRGLALRRMYRTITPWATENPILMHVTSTDPKVVKAAIDQCAEVGFEMVILSFGSGLNMEDPAPANHARMKELADYARAKGVEIGGYSLLASRSVSPEVGRRQSQDGPAGWRDLRQLALPGQRLGAAIPREPAGLLHQHGDDGARTRRLVSRRRVRCDRAPRPPRPGRFAVAAVEGDHRLLQVVPGPRHLPQRARLLLPQRFKQDRDGLPGDELVASSGAAAHPRPAEHLRRHMGEDA